MIGHLAKVTGGIPVERPQVIFFHLKIFKKEKDLAKFGSGKIISNMKATLQVL